jgi:hypothetical protein
MVQDETEGQEIRAGYFPGDGDEFMKMLSNLSIAVRRQRVTATQPANQTALSHVKFEQQV